MKIRLDYVTNSSSSSFLIAVRLTDMTKNEIYPKNMKSLFIGYERILRICSDVYFDSNSLTEYMHDYYDTGFNPGDPDSEGFDRYLELLEHINDGYVIGAGSIDYSNETAGDMFSDCVRTAGDNIIVIYHD